jgi:hypothetical protein
MADYFYGIARGTSNNPQAVVVGTSTGSTDIELHVSTTNNPTKKDVIRALRTIEQFILSNGVGTTTGPGVDLPPS